MSFLFKMRTNFSDPWVAKHENLFIKSNKIYYSKVLFPKLISLVLLKMCFVITSEIVRRVGSVG